jgi:hypothetical protein
MNLLTCTILALGLLTAAGAPLAIITFRWWEWRVLCWLDRRRNARKAQSYQTSARGTR